MQWLKLMPEGHYWIMHTTVERDLDLC